MEQFQKVNVARHARGAFDGWFVGPGPNGTFAVAADDNGQVYIVEAEAMKFILPVPRVQWREVAVGAIHADNVTKAEKLSILETLAQIARDCDPLTTVGYGSWEMVPPEERRRYRSIACAVLLNYLSIPEGEAQRLAALKAWRSTDDTGEHGMGLALAAARDQQWQLFRSL